MCSFVWSAMQRTGDDWEEEMDESRLGFCRVTDLHPRKHTRLTIRSRWIIFSMIDGCFTKGNDCNILLLTSFVIVVDERLSTDQSTRSHQLSHFIYSYSHISRQKRTESFGLLFNSITNHGGIARDRNERSGTIQWFSKYRKHCHNLQGWEKGRRYVNTRWFELMPFIFNPSFCLVSSNRYQRTSSNDRESCQRQRTSLHSPCSAWIGIDTEACEWRRHSSSDPLLLRFLIQWTRNSSWVCTIRCPGEKCQRL